MPHRLIDPTAQGRHFLFQFENAFLKILGSDGIGRVAVSASGYSPHVFGLSRI
jgi:hypothetical protein